MLVGLFPSPPHSLKGPHSPGKVSVSGPLLQKSQSETFPREVKSLIVGHKTFIWQRAEREGPPKQNSRGVPRKWSS